jgi:ABC-2 type transport system permease protein
MTSVIALAVKDLRILFRIRSGLFFTFAWPIIVAVLFGYVFSGQSTGRATLRVTLVDEDNTSGSAVFVTRLEQSGDFVIDRLPKGEAENLVRRGQRSAFVVIKPGFGEGSQRMFYGAPRQLEIGIDPSRQAEASMIEGLLTKHAMQDMQRLFSNPAESRKMVGDALSDLKSSGNSTATAPIQRFLGELDQFLGTPMPVAPGTGGSAEWQPLQVTKSPVVRELRGPANGFEVTFPQGVLWGIIGCVMTFAVGLVSERVRGTFVRLQIAPITRREILGGKALACFLSISLVQVMLFTFARLLFGVTPDSLPLLILACMCASAGFVGFMMMIAGLGETEQSVAGTGWALLMPMAMFGGAMIPQFVMPGWMLTVGYLSPIKWALLALEGAVWRGFTFTEMLLPCGILLAFGAVCFAIGTRGLRRA